MHSAISMPPATSTTWTTDDLPVALRAALEAALDKKAVAPAVLRVAELAGYTDWVMIVSARSERQVGAIANAIARSLKNQGYPARGTDGFEHHQWDLLDYDDFIVHVFHHPVRTHFDLESMWNDAPRVELGLPAEVMDTSSLDDAFAAPTEDFRGDQRFGGFEGEFEEDEWDEWDDELEDEGLVADEGEGEDKPAEDASAS